jgi:hypothetical protein
MSNHKSIQIGVKDSLAPNTKNERLKKMSLLKGNYYIDLSISFIGSFKIQNNKISSTSMSGKSVKSAKGVSLSKRSTGLTDISIMQSY